VPEGLALRLGALPAESPGTRMARLLWAGVIGSLGAALVALSTGTLVGDVIALWAISAAAVGLGLVLPFPYALVSPLYMGVLGWLVDMLPFVILCGWTSVTLRWLYGLLRERRRPHGGSWLLLPIALLFWAGTGVFVITSLDFKHFLLLVGIQFVISATIVAVVDRLYSLEDRTKAVSALVLLVIVLSAGVLLQWAGVPIESLQDTEARRRVEEAYGVDAFPNAIGMIKYARSVKPGVKEARKDLANLSRQIPDLPHYDVFRPRFQAYENSLVVQFQGSAAAHADVLAAADIDLVFDDVGLTPANSVPRLRSFPRNALTYAGVCAALFPFALFLAWTGEGRRRQLGWIGAGACLFGAAFSLARGAWAVLALGGIYLLVDGLVNKRMKLQYFAAIATAAVVLTGFFLLTYGVDPMTGRAGGGASVTTREDTYRDTLALLDTPRYFLFGYGTERPRTESGTVREGPGQRYVPRAGTHSTYLNYLFRTGVPGALLLLALYLIAGMHARVAARDKQGDDRLFFTACATSIVIVGAHAVILSLYVEPTYTLTVSVLLGLATSGVARLGRSVLPWRDRPATT
jgi:hypothetical protein